MTPAPALVARFQADLDRVRDGSGEGRRVAVAVSGGPDSMAMLALAEGAMPGLVIAATVDHRLRAASAGEAAMVAGWCADRGISHATLTPDAPIAGASIQAQARRARYALLGDWAAQAGAGALLTAHHADDQAETFLMRAARGAGPGGLAGIRPRWRYEAARWGGDTAACVEVLRPLLGWRRAELRAVAERCGLPFVDDPSNADDRHDRTRFRDWLAAAPWLDPARIGAAAAHCAEAEAALSAIADAGYADRERPAPDGTLRIDMSGLPRELRRRLARRAIGAVREMAAIAEPAWSDTANIEPLLDAITAGGSATRAAVLVSSEGDLWTFGPAPPRRRG